MSPVYYYKLQSHPQILLILQPPKATISAFGRWPFAIRTLMPTLINSSFNDMHNKQNQPGLNRRLYPHDQAIRPLKALGRYQQIQRSQLQESTAFNIPSMIASPVKFSQCQPSIQLSQREAISEAGSHFDLSIKDRMKSAHLNEMHQLIALAREKKSDIQDLLRKEASKAENEDQSPKESSASLRKLKKVVRLLEIVCKMILGKEAETTTSSSLLRSSSFYPISHQETLHSEIFEQKIDNLLHQVAVKDSEIKRLRKLVEILSAPDKSLSKQREDFPYSYEEEVVKTSAIVNIDLKEACMQTDERSVNRPLCHSQLSIQHAYSLWNIFPIEHCESELSSPIKTLQQAESFPIPSSIGVQDSNRSVLSSDLKVTRPYLSITPMQSMHISPTKSYVMKRFKSLTKITMKCLNWMVMFLLQSSPDPQIQQLNRQLDKFTTFFNTNYHKSDGIYDDAFILESQQRLKDYCGLARQKLIAAGIKME